MPEQPAGKPIDFDNLDDAKRPSKENSGFSAMDTVKPSADANTKTTGDQAEVDPAQTGSAKADDFASEEEDKNKLPPAAELEKEEENPEQRKIAGEAPYITARNPAAFTPEKEGGVVDEKGQSKEEINTETPADNSVPEL